jgi:predicted dehydrogenase
VSEPLRWGVMGTGFIAAAFTADLELTDSGSVVAVGSRAAATAEAFAARLGIPRAHHSYEDLLADEGVDAVYVATPHPFHRPHAELALRAGKAVLVEKPFTVSAAQARELVGLARERRAFLMEAMWTRFLPHIARVRKLLDDGALGEIVTVMADHGQRFEEDPDHRLYAPALGGGALLDLGVYAVSFASMVLGAPERVVSVVTPAFTGVDAQSSIVLGYASGAQAVLNCTLSADSPRRAAIVGTRGRIEIDGPFFAPAAFTLIGADGRAERYAEPHAGHGLRHQADEVARCLGAGLLESPLMGLEESVSIMATIDAALADAGA